MKVIIVEFTVKGKPHAIHTRRFIDKSFEDINTLLFVKFGEYEPLNIISADDVKFCELSNLKQFQK
jgi:hypothetical protein